MQAAMLRMTVNMVTTVGRMTSWSMVEVEALLSLVTSVRTGESGNESEVFWI